MPLRLSSEMMNKDVLHLDEYRDDATKDDCITN